MLELLQELQDIVEQIDYARAFCHLSGLHFLLGIVSSPLVLTKAVEPDNYNKKDICIEILVTLCYSFFSG